MLSNKQKYFLSMFPYPTGTLHVGHWRVYSFILLFKNYYELLGEESFCPMGWDALGLPAELAAIKNKIEPSVWTKDNIEQMKEDFKKFNFDFSSFEMSTLDETYYFFEQQIFIKMFDLGLVYFDTKLMPFCSNCNTVLSSEQSINNACWRCENTTSEKKTEQVFIKITNFAKELYDSIDDLNWDHEVKARQKRWIGEYLIPCKYNNSYFLIPENKLIKYSKTEINILDSSEGYDKFQTTEKLCYLQFQTYLKDWCISRQRSWGVPVPLINCPECGVFSDLNVEFKIPKYTIGIFSKEYTDVQCKFCFKKAKRISHTLDTFFASSWYMYRFPELKNFKQPFSNKDIGVDLYVGGIEHATMHLIYTRFFELFFKKTGMINIEQKVLNNFKVVGIVLNQSIFCLTCNSYLKQNDLCGHENYEFKLEKMSKSKLNGVNLTELTKNFNPEIIKLYILASCPISKSLIWDDKNLLAYKNLYMKLTVLFKLNSEFSQELEELINLFKYYLDLSIQQCDGFNALISYFFKFINTKTLGDFTQKKKILCYLFIYSPILAELINKENNFNIVFMNSFASLSFKKQYLFTIIYKQKFLFKIESIKLDFNKEDLFLYCANNFINLPNYNNIIFNRFTIVLI